MRRRISPAAIHPCLRTQRNALRHPGRNSGSGLFPEYRRGTNSVWDLHTGSSSRHPPRTTNRNGPRSVSLDCEVGLLRTHLGGCAISVLPTRPGQRQAVVVEQHHPVPLTHRLVGQQVERRLYQRRNVVAKPSLGCRSFLTLQDPFSGTPLELEFVTVVLALSMAGRRRGVWPRRVVSTPTCLWSVTDIRRWL